MKNQRFRLLYARGDKDHNFLLVPYDALKSTHFTLPHKIECGQIKKCNGGLALTCIRSSHTHTKSQWKQKQIKTKGFLLSPRPVGRNRAKLWFYMTILPLFLFAICVFPTASLSYALLWQPKPINYSINMKITNQRALIYLDFSSSMCLFDRNFWTCTAIFHFHGLFLRFLW